MVKKKLLVASLLVLGLCGGLAFMYSDFGSFVLALVKSPKKVGAVMPSSIFLAKAITRHIVKGEVPMRILEVGAGTGVFTEQIVKKMDEQDRLDVIEIDKDLCKILRQKFQNNKNVHVYDISILDWTPGYEYDFIISGLPFNSLGTDFVVSVLDTYTKIIKNNGILSYFEYVLISEIKRFFIRGAERIDYLQGKFILSKFRKSFEFEKDFVLLNIPPAYAYHLKLKK